MMRPIKCNYGIDYMVGLRNSQLCNSTAKQMYSFSRTQRFPDLKAECPNHSYVAGYKFNSRRTTFGYGKKSDFTAQTGRRKFPAPTDYNFKTESRMGKTFGVSRNQSRQQSYICQEALKVPGPGKYQHHTIQISPVAYTMRPNYPNIKFVKNTSQYNPGPGQYQSAEKTKGISKYETGKYYSCPKDQRFKAIVKTPGPLDYQEKINQTFYANSVHKYNGAYVFDKQARTGFTERQVSIRKQLPGPGYYQFSSDFGQLNPESAFAKVASPSHTIA